MDTSSEAPPEAFDFLTLQRFDQQLLVSWSNAKGAKSYELHYGTAAATYTSMKILAKSPATISGLTPGTTYYFRVKAINELGTVDSSSEKSFPFMGAPGAFNQLTATPGLGQIALTWETSPEASSYTVTYGTTAGAFPTTAGSTALTNFLVTGLSNNVTYYFKVTATNAAGSMASANSLAALIGPPEAFTLTTATPSSTQVVLNWNASNRATNYTVRYGTSAGTYPTTAGTTASTAYTVTGLSNSVPYYFQVSANNSAGSTDSTNSLSATPNAPPSVPLSPTASVDTGKCTIEWMPPASGSPPITYTVRRIVNPSTSVPVCSDISVRTCSEDSLSSGTHVYRVEAINVAGPGPQTADISCNLSPPAAVSLANPAGAAIGNQQVTLTWTGGDRANSFTVKYGTLNPPTTVASTSATSPFIVTGLTNGTLYYFQVEAINPYGTVVSTVRSATPTSNAPNVTILDPSLTVNTGIAQLITLGDTYSRRFSVADPDPGDTVDCGSATMNSSNPGVIPNVNLSVSGSGGTCTFSVASQVGVYGQAGITLSVSDGTTPRNITLNAYALPTPTRIYSWRRHRGYNGPALTVRNGSGTETDIYFDSTTGLVDPYLTTFSGTTGRLVRWYDQSGAGKHAYQTDQDRQPRVQLSNGILQITADGTTVGTEDFMIIPDFPTSPTLTAFTHFVLTAQATDASLLSFGNKNPAAFEGFEIGRTAASVWNITSAVDAGNLETTVGPALSTALLGQAMVLNTSGSPKRNFITAVAAPATAPTTSSGTLTSYVPSSQSDAYLFSGGTDGTSRFMRGWIRELLIFDRELSATEVKALSTQN